MNCDEEKNIFEISFQKFGNNKKLVQSLHPLRRSPSDKTKNMLRRQVHIETRNWFSPKGDYTNCGACSE